MTKNNGEGKILVTVRSSSRNHGNIKVFHVRHEGEEYFSIEQFNGQTTEIVSLPLGSLDEFIEALDGVKRIYNPYRVASLNGPVRHGATPVNAASADRDRRGA